MNQQTTTYYLTIRCDTQDVLCIDRRHRDASRYCHSDAVQINAHNQALALDGCPFIRIDHARMPIGTDQRALEIAAQTGCGLGAAWEHAVYEANRNLLDNARSAKQSLLDDLHDAARDAERALRDTRKGG
jgi:hypothetical protein